MSTLKTAAEARGKFLERLDGSGEPMAVDGRLVALTDPHGTAAESYRMLLYRLRQARAQGEAGGVVVAVTSAVRGEGVSLTAANLALTAARTGEARVALIDCDLRRGSLGALFGMGARPGLSELLAGRAELGEAFGKFHEGHLAVAPAGKPPAEPAALLAGARFSTLIGELRNLFDEVYLDVPPVLATADSSIVAHRSDGVLLVAKADATPRDQVASAVRSLAGTALLGVVLNGVEPGRVPAPLPAVRGSLASRKLLGKPRE
jgi:capsular exopolysaccharide synthesis family protein